jgi:hypothetical protein
MAVSYNNVITSELLRQSRGYCFEKLWREISNGKAA